MTSHPSLDDRSARHLLGILNSPARRCRAKGTATGAVKFLPPAEITRQGLFETELPRFPMKEPVGAQQAIVVRPGFHVELVAAEPLLRSPVAIDFDEEAPLRRRVPEYNQHVRTERRRTRGGRERGCIRMLEDADGDGAYDKARVRRRCADGDRRRLLGRRRLRRLSARHGLPQGHRRRRQGRCAASSTPGSAATRPARACQFVPVGDGQSLPHLNRPEAGRCSGDRAEAKTVSSAVMASSSIRGESFQLTGGGASTG